MEMLSTATSGRVSKAVRVPLNVATAASALTIDVAKTTSLSVPASPLPDSPPPRPQLSARVAIAAAVARLKEKEEREARIKALEETKAALTKRKQELLSNAIFISSDRLFVAAPPTPITPISPRSPRSPKNFPQTLFVQTNLAPERLSPTGFSPRRPVSHAVLHFESLTSPIRVTTPTQKAH